MKNRFKTFVSLVLVLGLSLVIPSAKPLLSYSNVDPLPTYLSISDQTDSQQVYQYLQKLCSPEFEGRQTGTIGGDKAAQWIGDMFKGFGLKPAYSGEDSFFQTYKAPCFNLLPEVSFMITTKAGNIPFVYKQDFVPSPASGSGTASGAIVFVGYGITNQEKNYDDYGGIDVKNKIVLMLRKAPTTISLPETDSYFTTKVSNARTHGAIGVIIAEKEGEKNPYSMMSKSTSGILNNDVPSVFVPTIIADKILAESNTTVLELQRSIDDAVAPNSKSIKAGAYIQVTMSMETKETKNVIGYIPAEDPLSQQSILITAHYDHLGKDLINGDLYPGANDNASGTAALMEAARVLSSNCYIPTMNIVFIAFSGEEEGLLGSAYYIENPLFPLKKIAAVLNMDMVGTGTGSIYAGTNFKELTENISVAAKSLKIQVPISKNLVYGGSDQLLFARSNVPAVFFIRDNPTGIGDYHSPLDTPDTVNPNNLVEQARLIIMVTSLYANPKTLIFDTKTDYWFRETSHHERILIHATGTPGITGQIQNQTFAVPESGLLVELVQLQEGSNLIQIQIQNSSQEIIFERMISINAKINQELDADFNFDLAVNFDDLLIFAQIYPTSQIKTALEALCDLNRDKSIDEKDFILLKKRYDYKLEK